MSVGKMVFDEMTWRRRYLSFFRSDDDGDVVAPPVDHELVPLAVDDGHVGNDLHRSSPEVQGHFNPVGKNRDL